MINNNKAKEAKDLESLSSNVRTLMWNHNMTQGDLGRVIGVPQATVNRVLNLKSMPKVSTIKNIAEFYSVSIDSLLEKNGVLLDPTIRNSRLMNKLKSEMGMIPKQDSIPFYRKFYNMLTNKANDNANS